MTDPIADFLTQVRNAVKAGLAECTVPHSTMKAGIAQILKQEGFIGDLADGTCDDGHKTLVIKLKYAGGAPVINNIKRISTPGRRLYYRHTEIPRVLNGLGISILSTSRGLMKDADARRQKIGGELVCTVW